MLSMKRRICSLLSAAAIAGSLFPAGVLTASADTAPIYGWTASTAGSASCGVTSDFYAEGGHSAVLRAEASGDTAVLQTNISVQKGKSYNISFWVKAVNCGSLNCTFGNALCALLPQSSSYSWTKFSMKYSHTDEDTVLPLSFELKKSGEAYIDSVVVLADEKGVSQNMVKNFSFESTDTAVSGDALAEYSQTDVGKISYSGRDTLPLFYNNSIAIDGDLSDWDAGCPEITLPDEGQSVSTISGYSGKEDMTAVFKMAYDDEYLYISAAVTDDVHNQNNPEEDKFWRGDSIQMVLGSPDEDYGVEIGFYLKDSGEAKVYSSALIRDEWGTVDPAVIELREKTKCSALRDGNVTYYEMAVPWAIKFEQRPEEFLLDLLINDNDGSGRGYLEWRDGIAVTKSNEKFPQMVLVKPQSEVFGYIDGGKDVMENSEAKYHLYIYNLSDAEKDISIQSEDNEKQDVKLAAGNVYLLPLAVKSGGVGEKLVTAQLNYDGGSYTAAKTVAVKRDLAKAFEELRSGELEELKALQAQCKEKGIATDYEDIDLVTFESFIDYGLEDYNGGRITRAEYVYACLEKIYADAKAALSSYLDGSAAPKEAVYYVSGDTEIQNQAVYGTVKNSTTGETYRAPVFLSGYLDNTGKSYEISTVGANMLQFEVMMSGYVKKADSILGWNTGYYGGANASYSYDDTTAKSGFYSLKISNSSAKASNVYTTMSQKLALKGGKTYVLSFNAKAESANGCSYRPDGWKSSKISISGTYDWKRYSYEYKPEQDCEVELMFMSEDVTSALWLDNIKVTEKGDSTNLVRQGTFEEKPVIINGYMVDTARFKRDVITALDEAARNNVAVDVLMSVHYFPQGLLPEEEWKANQIGAVKYNLYNEKVKELTEAFFKGLVPLMANHKALNSVCISNEPTYRVGRDAFNAPLWQQYLRELYNDDVTLMNNIWHEEFESFEAVPMQESYENPAMYYDYLKFNDKLFAQWHTWVKDIIKEIAPDLPVHAKVMSVIDQKEASGANFALVRGTDPELFAEFSDFNGNDSWNFIGSGRTLTVKNLWYDLLTSIKNAPIFNSEDHVIMDRDEVYNEKYAPHVAADLWQGAVHGRSLMAMWKWDRTLLTTNSTSGNIKHRPDVVAKEGRTMLELNRLAGEVEALQNIKPQVALLYSYASRVYETSHMNGVYNLYQAIGNNGQRAKIVTENIIANNGLDGIKLLIVPAAASARSDELEAIKAFMQNGGRVLLVGDCFCYDEHKNAFADNEALSYILENAAKAGAAKDEAGTGLIVTGGASAAVRSELAAAGLYDIEVINNKTGEPVSDFEWCYTDYDGGLLLNLCRYSWEDGSVSIRINGETAAGMVDLKSGETLGSEFEMSGYEPRLIKIG